MHWMLHTFFVKFVVETLVDAHKIYESVYRATIIAH